VFTRLCTVAVAVVGRVSSAFGVVVAAEVLVKLAAHLLMLAQAAQAFPQAQAA
jgi:hypothetical protein